MPQLGKLCETNWRFLFMRGPSIGFSHLFLLCLSKLPYQSSLPTIDISSCDASNTFEIRLDCYYAIDAALRKYGTFVAINHGIQPSYFEKSFTYADELFSLDITSKLGVSMSQYPDDFGRGYIRTTGTCAVHSVESPRIP